MTHLCICRYTKLGDVVDHFFPPLIENDEESGPKVPTGNFPAPDSYSTFTYWREPLPDIEAEIELFNSPEEGKS